MNRPVGGGTGLHPMLGEHPRWRWIARQSAVALIGSADWSRLELVLR